MRELSKLNSCLLTKLNFLERLMLEALWASGSCQTAANILHCSTHYVFSILALGCCTLLRQVVPKQLLCVKSTLPNPSKYGRTLKFLECLILEAWWASGGRQAAANILHCSTHYVFSIVAFRCRTLLSKVVPKQLLCIKSTLPPSFRCGRRLNFLKCLILEAWWASGGRQAAANILYV